MRVKLMNYGKYLQTYAFLREWGSCYFTTQK